MRKFAAVLFFVALGVAYALSDDPDPGSEFTFARVQFTMDFRSAFDREEPWHHDYPDSENLYLTMIKEVSGIHTTHDSYKIVRFDDPEIFQYPFLYVSEPGFMDLTEDEVQGLRQYLNRGGFVMFDDFRGRDLQRLQYQMKQVFPERHMFRLDVSHEIFHSFYDIESLDMVQPYQRPDMGFPEFWGMEDDRKRLIMVANYNNDFGEFWEWVNRREMEFQPAAQSIRFGINYLVYAMTH